MQLGIAGKTAVVIGGSRGQGLAVSTCLAEEGCRVVVVGMTPGSAEAAASNLAGLGYTARGVDANVTDPAQVDALFANVRDHEGGVDILVYNTSGPPRPVFETATDEEYYEAYRIAVMGFAWCVKQAVEDMKPRGWGRIVTLGSYTVKEPHLDPPLVLHNLARPAAVGLSKSLSNEFGQFGITINTIGIGPSDNSPESGNGSRFRDLAARQGITYAELSALRAATIPMRRLGRPDELAALCVFLCSDRAGFITGQTIMFDGGKAQALL